MNFVLYHSCLISCILAYPACNITEHHRAASSPCFTCLLLSYTMYVDSTRYIHLYSQITNYTEKQRLSFAYVCLWASDVNCNVLNSDLFQNNCFVSYSILYTTIILWYFVGSSKKIINYQSLKSAFVLCDMNVFRLWARRLYHTKSVEDKDPPVFVFEYYVLALKYIY